MTAPDLTHYAEIIVRAGGITEWERKFCASIVRQRRQGRQFTAKQLDTMGRIVGKFQDAVMRDEGVVE